MPIYDYKCNNCGRISEVFIRSADTGDITRSGCERSKLEKLISSSYLVRTGNSPAGNACCGRTERCETPPCSTGEGCQRH